MNWLRNDAPRLTVKPGKAGRPVFDASAVLALLQGETGADRLQVVQGEALISAVNAAEVIAKLVSRGTPLPAAQAAFEALHLEVTQLDADLAQASGQYVHKGVSLGDRCFLATAQQFGQGWTSDRDLGKIHFNTMPVLQFFR